MLLGGDVTRLGKFCGTADFRDAIYSQRNGVFELRFVTDLSIEYSGFVLEVQAIGKKILAIVSKEIHVQYILSHSILSTDNCQLSNFFLVFS